MKLALLAPVVWRTPPRLYGPWEQVASNIAEGLVARGVDVTLFATGDSITRGKLDYCIDKPSAESEPRDMKVNECLHISHLMERAGEFDLIHNNYDFLPLTYSRLISTPIVTTIHGFSSPLILPVYKKYNKNCYYVSISDSDRSPELDYIATVYNGIDVSAFDFNDRPGDYLLFFGRIHPEKGTKDAIGVAKRCGRKIIIAGLIQHEEYFDKEIRPLIDDREVVYVGNCGPAERNRILGNAFALLHLVHFDEPFGLSVAEAMCCGTPVIAYRRGSMPELIRDNETGFLVNDFDGAVSAVERVPRIDRNHCRQWAVSRFSMEKMIDGYLEVYEKILGEGSGTSLTENPGYSGFG